MELKWDESGKRFFETGVDRGVLYPKTDAGAYAKGVAWNGLTAVTESPSGAEATPLYADNIKYLNLQSNEEFGGTIEAYTYPDEFEPCQGNAKVTGADGLVIAQQHHTEFGLCYRTRLGNDSKGSGYGYKLHLVYNALAQPSEKGYETINDTPDAITFSWEFSTTPTETGVDGVKPAAHLIIDSSKADDDKLAALEAILYGTNGEGSATGTDPRLPTIAEVISTLSGTTPGPGSEDDPEVGQ